MARRSFAAQLQAEIDKQIGKDPELLRKGKEYADEVADEVRATALRDMDAGYATGEFVASIGVKRKRGKGRDGLPAWRIASSDRKAHLLEYGTEDTPEYGSFGKVTFRHGGTMG